MTLSELTRAFQLGHTISLPFKLLLFVMLDGWTRLVHGLVLSYR